MKVEELEDEASRDAAAWQLGLDEQVVEGGKRRVEIGNFIEYLVRLGWVERGRS